MGNLTKTTIAIVVSLAVISFPFAFVYYVIVGGYFN